MSFKDAINRASDMSERQRIENIHLSHEHNKFWDNYYKQRVQPFVLLTTDENVLSAYEKMINNKNNDAFYSENNFVNT